MAPKFNPHAVGVVHIVPVAAVSICSDKVVDAGPVERFSCLGGKVGQKDGPIISNSNGQLNSSSLHTILPPNALTIDASSAQVIVCTTQSSQNECSMKLMYVYVNTIITNTIDESDCVECVVSDCGVGINNSLSINARHSKLLSCLFHTYDIMCVYLDVR